MSAGEGFQSAHFLNQHPLNQHALKLLPGWSLRPIPGQLHILTLASAALFANAPQKTALAHLRAAPPEVALAHFLQVAAFDALYLAEDRPLESTHLILAATALFENLNEGFSPLCLRVFSGR